MYKQETNCNSITNKIECTINTKLEGGKGHFSQNSEFFFATQEVLSKAQATIKKVIPQMLSISGNWGSSFQQISD